MTPRPFRFGILNFSGTSRDEWRSKCVKVEELGYSTFLVADHLSSFPPIVGMLEAAEATSRLRVGSYVFGNDFRHPVMLAREAAAIDLMSNGRLEFGLGTGFYIDDYKQSGMKLDAPGVRVSRLEEALQIIKGMWGDKPFTFTGNHYSVHEVDCIPKPIQKPHPPFMIGGGSKRILSIAAREADIVSLNIKTTADGGFDFTSLTREATQEKLKWIREAAGARFDNLELNIVVPISAITDDRQTLAEQIVGNFKQGGIDIQADQILASPGALIGNIDQIVDQLQEQRERDGISYICIFEDQLEAFAPVVARLSGK